MSQSLHGNMQLDDRQDDREVIYRTYSMSLYALQEGFESEVRRGVDDIKQIQSVMSDDK